MNYSAWRWSAITVAIGLVAIVSTGCIATGGGYGYDGNVGVGVDYYEPAGVEYGGWGRGYRVAPFRGGGDHRAGPGNGRAHAYRSAPASHSVPSIPSRSRGGSSHPKHSH
jgi:hypothetical protein